MTLKNTYTNSSQFNNKKKKISNLNSDSNNSTNPIHEAYVIKGEKQRRKGQSQVHPRLIQGEKDKQAISPSTRKSSSAGFTAPLSSPPSTRFDRAKKWKGRLVAWCHAPWHYLPGLLYRYLVARAGPGNSCSRGEHRRWMNKVRGTPCCRRVPPAFKMWIPRSFLCLAVALHLEERQISLRKYSDPNDHFTLSTNLCSKSWVFRSNRIVRKSFISYFSREIDYGDKFGFFCVRILVLRFQ